MSFAFGSSVLQHSMQRLQRVRKTSITFAPEAGTQRMRDTINKNVKEEDLSNIWYVTDEQYKGTVQMKDPYSEGVNMDFLTQEIFREINTLGNKAASVEVSPLIVQLKTEVEQIREQIQNIE